MSVYNASSTQRPAIGADAGMTETQRREVVAYAQSTRNPEQTLNQYLNFLGSRERSAALDADARRQTNQYQSSNNIDAKSYAQKQRIDTAAERERLKNQRVNDFFRGETGNQIHEQQMRSARQELDSLERRTGMTTGAEVDVAQIGANATMSSTRMETDMQRYLGELQAQNQAAELRRDSMQFQMMQALEHSRLAAQEAADRRQSQTQLMGYALKGSDAGSWRYW